VKRLTDAGSGVRGHTYSFDSLPMEEVRVDETPRWQLVGSNS
jgi:hypothetical protein